MDFTFSMDSQTFWTNSRSVCFSSGRDVLKEEPFCYGQRIRLNGSVGKYLEEAFLCMLILDASACFLPCYRSTSLSIRDANKPRRKKGQEFLSYKNMSCHD